MACVSFAPDKRFRMDDTHRNLDGTLLRRGEHFGVSLLRGGAADGGRVGFTARHGGVGGCLGGGFRRVVCALRPVPLAVVARHGFEKLGEHTTFEGELRSTRRKVGENPRSTVRLPRWSASGAGRVREVGVFLQFQILGPV